MPNIYDRIKGENVKTIIATVILAATSTIYADTYNIYNIHPNAQVNFVNGNAVIQQGNNNQVGINTAVSRRPVVLHRDYRTYHLGDEQFRSRKWTSLHGQCYFIDFNDDGLPGRFYLSLSRFGTESAAVFVNREPVGYLPRQYRGRRKRPNYWSAQEWIDLPANYFYRGRNTVAICSSPVPRPEFPGDVDDFQIRNIELWKN
jgi:hypothetical protein